MDALVPTRVIHSFRLVRDVCLQLNRSLGLSPALQHLKLTPLADACYAD